MIRTDAVSYGSDARLAMAGAAGAAPSSSLTSTGARAVPGGFDESRCSATKADGSWCTAYPAKGTELCAGHLRSIGRL